MLEAEVNSLLDVAVLHLLVDDDADGALGDVVDDTGLAVVDLVRHTIEFLVSLESIRRSEPLARIRSHFIRLSVWIRFGIALLRIGVCLTPSGQHHLP